MTDTPYEVVFMPFATMRTVSEFSFGRATLWNLGAAPQFLLDQHVRERVQLLLGMHRAHNSNPQKAQRLSGIGVLSVGRVDQRVLSDSEFREVRALQRALFLCRLARNVRLRGPNAGHSLMTAE